MTAAPLVIRQHHLRRLRHRWSLTSLRPPSSQYLLTSLTMGDATTWLPVTDCQVGLRFTRLPQARPILVPPASSPVCAHYSARSVSQKCSQVTEARSLLLPRHRISSRAGVFDTASPRLISLNRTAVRK